MSKCHQHYTISLPERIHCVFPTSGSTLNNSPYLFKVIPVYCKGGKLLCDVRNGIPFLQILPIFLCSQIFRSTI